MAYQFAFPSPTAFATLAAAIALATFPRPAWTEPGKSAFYASSTACVEQGRFKAAECAAAFERARQQMGRVPGFSAKVECELRFGYCERRGAGFAPAMLGVEMLEARGGAISQPALAVESPAGIFAERPATSPRSSVPAIEILGKTPIRPTGKFIPFALFRNMSVFANGAIRSEQLEFEPGGDAALQHAERRENTDDRRRRLQAAPFIQ